MKLFKKILMISVLGSMSAWSMDGNRQNPSMENLTNMDAQALADSDLNLRLTPEDWGGLLGDQVNSDQALDLKQKVAQASRLRTQRSRINPDEARLAIGEAQHQEGLARENIGSGFGGISEAQGITEDLNQSIARILRIIAQFSATANQSAETLRLIEAQVEALTQLYAQSQEISEQKAATLESLNQKVAKLQEEQGATDVTLREIQDLMHNLQG